MAHRFHMTLTKSQYDFLSQASENTSLSMAELIRRADDEKYSVSSGGFARSQFTLALWRRPNGFESIRRRGIRLD